MALDVKVTADEVLEQEATTEIRSGYLNTRMPASLMKQLKLLAYYLTEKRRLTRKAAKTISRGDTVVRVLAAAVTSIWKNDGLPAEPDKAAIDAKLDSLRVN